MSQYAANKKKKIISEYLFGTQIINNKLPKEQLKFIASLYVFYNMRTRAFNREF